MDSLSVVIASPEFVFGATAALAFEDLTRRALKHRLGLDDTDESAES